MGMLSTRSLLSGVVLAVAAVLEIVLSFVLYREDGAVAVRNTGWVVLWISAVFGWLPIVFLKKWGGVPKGKAYVHTKTLVDRGVYGIVRHPQYLAGILLGASLSLIAQHWLVAVLGGVVVFMSYSYTFEEERVLEEKFGAEYEAYRERVPRVNFVAGLVRLLLRGGGEGEGRAL
jgi:protein-S-isoprenylcysteine O-methyltransferase Ste14